MIDRVAIFKQVVEFYDFHYAEVKATGYGGCLYWMQAGMVTLIRAGLRPQVQAGSAHWRILPESMDDGQRATHFGFEWEPNHPSSIRQRAQDLLPEMHCWMALIETQEIIDFSTHTLPGVCQRFGHIWHTPPPPDFIWVKADALPKGMVYHANFEATKFLHDFIKRKFINPTKQKET